jgi:hypothetical protein
MPVFTPTRRAAGQVVQAAQPAQALVRLGRQAQLEGVVLLVALLELRAVAGGRRVGAEDRVWGRRADENDLGRGSCVPLLRNAVVSLAARLVVEEPEGAAGAVGRGCSRCCCTGPRPSGRQSPGRSRPSWRTRVASWSLVGMMLLSKSNLWPLTFSLNKGAKSADRGSWFQHERTKAGDVEHRVEGDGGRVDLAVAELAVDLQVVGGLQMARAPRRPSPRSSRPTSRP